jgi:hypothetical protein
MKLDGRILILGTAPDVVACQLAGKITLLEDLMHDHQPV